MKFIIAFSVICLLILSCSTKEKTFTVKSVDGVEVISNSTIPANPELKLELKEVACINCNDISEKDSSESIQLTNMELDDEGNIYIIDSRKSKIHKFAPDGKKLLSFGRLGQGPGEFQSANFFVVWHDTVYVPFQQSLKLLKFSTDGKFIMDKQYAKIEDFPVVFWKSTKFVNALSITPLPKEGNNIYERHVSIFDEKFNKLRTFYTDKVDDNVKVVNLNTPPIPSLGVTTDSLVYVPVYSQNEYIVEVFDFKGNKKQIIRKQYGATPYSKNELERINKALAENGLTTKSTHKNSIYLINIDKYNRLWVSVAGSEKEKGTTYDIFEKGVYQNSVKIPVAKTAIVDFIEGKLVAYDVAQNQVKYFDY